MTTAAGQPRIWNYEEICNSCRELVADMDAKRWIIGDTALEVETRYSQHTMEDFSREIGQNISTVKNWKRVAKFYPAEFRRELIESNPNLTYTYFRDALRLENLQLATEWLAECSSNGWSADEAARKLTERLGRQTRESIKGYISRWTKEDSEYRFEIIVSEADKNILENYEHVIIKPHD